jgi:lipid-A-disaccharide synthase
VSTVLVSCGEASGDLLLSGVVRALKAADPSTRVVGLVGGRSREAGAEARWDVSALSVMGIAEVLPKLRSIFRLMDEMETFARTERPDVALLVDAPDFNLRLAKRLKKQGIRVVYYVSPTVWAWRSGRVKTVAKYVDEMCCVLPFEEPWYRARGAAARFVGHPLLEWQPSREAELLLRNELLAGGTGPLLALLPGSRGMEIRNLLPAMLGAAKRLTAELPGLEVVLPVAPTVRRETIEALAKTAGFMPKLVDGRAREVLGACDAALVTSGTATLEATLAEAPMVVAYRAGWLTYWTYRLLVKAKHVSLPNILAGEGVVPELLQDAVTAEALAARVRPLLEQSAARAQMKTRLAAIRASLGTPGASARVAAIVAERLLVAGNVPEPVV